MEANYLHFTKNCQFIALDKKLFSIIFNVLETFACQTNLNKKGQ
jgi:hypothetical protein